MIANVVYLSKDHYFAIIIIITHFDTLYCHICSITELFFMFGLEWFLYEFEGNTGLNESDVRSIFILMCMVFQII